MGKIQAQKDQQQATTPEADEVVIPEDLPVVKTLKELDDKYLALEEEYEKLSQKLLLKYTEQQRPLLEERKALLLDASNSDGPLAGETGTPGMKGFWLKAMLNHPAFEETIQRWDEPVLEYLQDIETSHVDDEDSNKGFKLLFRFAPNPYFEQTELVKEYITEMTNPYYGDIDVKEVKSTIVEWKAGMDVTVEKVSKKVKGGGAKKAKQKQQEKEEPRPSIFRDFFKNLAAGDNLTDEMREQVVAMGGGDDDDDEEGEIDGRFLEYLMEQDFQVGSAVRDNIIPYAIRWYTGEACPDDSDDDDDEDGEEEDDEDDESGTELAEDDESESATPNRRGKGKSTKPKSEKPAQEECKQQ